MYRAGRRFLLPALSILAACGTQPSDPNALPSWIAPYPGSQVQKSGSAFVFETKDPTEKVLDFYERQLTQSGVHKEARGGGDYGGFLSAGDDSHARNVMIDIRPDKGLSAVSITVVAKN
jgi:hypothetical protein